MKPPIVALFLVVFDQKVGYTIKWNRTIPDLDIDGVEYKSLPSGLHSLSDDIIHFIHGAYAGISAFRKIEADASQRNANFIAVGALVSLPPSGTSSCWLHTQGLRRIAQELVVDHKRHQQLERFWELYKTGGVVEEDLISMTGSTSFTETQGQTPPQAKLDTADLAAHPLLSSIDLLDTFGPLLFPIYRAAVLRQRILFLGHPPVHRTCDFVHALATLANLPTGLEEVLSSEKRYLKHTRPLFNVGITDISRLTNESTEQGWIACSTDDILGEKQGLWDVLVRMPKRQDVATANKTWPVLQSSTGTNLKASQRDLRRYRALRAWLKRLSNDSRASAMRGRETDVVESSSWTAMAYNGFMWWASANEEYAWEQEEAQFDRDLLRSLFDGRSLSSDAIWTQMSKPATFPLGSAEANRYAIAAELLAYMQQTTTKIIHGIAEIVNNAHGDSDTEVPGDAITIDSEDLPHIGLDSWHDSDKAFIIAVIKLYFGRKAQMAASGLQLCGLKIL